MVIGFRLIPGESQKLLNLARRAEKLSLITFFKILLSSGAKFVLSAKRFSYMFYPWSRLNLCQEVTRSAYMCRGYILKVSLILNIDWVLCSQTKPSEIDIRSDDP